MLRKVEDLKGYKIHATDGELGTVRDLYFQDDRWTVRYRCWTPGVGSAAGRFWGHRWPWKA